MPRKTLLALAFAAPFGLVWMACGGRTGLLTPIEPPTPDSGLEDSPAGLDAADAADAEDSPEDVEFDQDDTSFPDVPVIDLCPDAGATLIYVITQEGDLYSFYPPTLEFRLIGTINCSQSAGMPFSMAVDRTGIGYSVFTDGTLHVVDMANAACKNTPFVPGQHGFLTFGMGFVANTGDAGETLYVAEGNVIQTPRPYSMGLASISPTSLALTYVAPFSPPIVGPELTGTGLTSAPLGCPAMVCIWVGGAPADTGLLALS